MRGLENCPSPSHASSSCQCIELGDIGGERYRSQVYQCLRSELNASDACEDNEGADGLTTPPLPHAHAPLLALSSELMVVHQEVE